MLISVFALCSCTTFDNFRYTFLEDSDADDNTIYIGVYEPQTGSASAVGKEEIRGIELAHSIYNNVNGYNVKLIKVDTQSNSNAAKAAIKNLIDRKPVAIIGSCGEANSLIASEAVAKAKIPTITPSAVNPLITQDNGYYFRACLSDSQMGAGLAEYVYDNLKSRKIGVVRLKNDSTVSDLIDGFNDKLTSMRGSSADPVIMRSETEITNMEWDGLIKEIKKAGCDTVLLPIGVDAMDSFLTAAEKKGLDGLTIVGTKSWGTKDFIKLQKMHRSFKLAFPYDAVINEGRSTSDTVTAETQRFIIQYTNRYGGDQLPTQNAALGYDAYLLVINAISNAKSNDGALIRKSLSELKDIHGATGVFRFDNSGNTIRTVNIATIKDGSIVSDYVTKDTTEAGSLEAVK